MLQIQINDLWIALTTIAVLGTLAILFLMMDVRELRKLGDFLHWRVNNPPPKEWDQPTAAPKALPAEPTEEVIPEGEGWKYGIRPDGERVD